MNPNCLECKHFYITWDKECPRACKAFGFKGKMMPSQSVLEATGKECPLFKKKQTILSKKKSNGWTA